MSIIMSMLSLINIGLGFFGAYMLIIFGTKDAIVVGVLYFMCFAFTIVRSLKLFIENFNPTLESSEQINIVGNKLKQSEGKFYYYLADAVGHICIILLIYYMVFSVPGMRQLGLLLAVGSLAFQLLKMFENHKRNGQP